MVGRGELLMRIGKCCYEEHMKKILISPYSKLMRNGQKNPKNYPYWKEVVAILKSRGYHIVQVGVSGEEPIDADEVCNNKRLKDLKKMLLESDGWASVDNFFNHFATFYGKKGVVVFGRSDPLIFGYAQNINLLKSRDCLREQQFELWEQDVFREDVFVDPSIVADAIVNL